MSDTGYGVKVIQAAGSSNVIGALLKHMAEGETQSENRNGGMLGRVSLGGVALVLED